MKLLRMYLDFKPTDWNTYINAERTNRYKASKIKKDDIQTIKRLTVGKKYEGDYPVKITVINYFKDKRRDLDNTNLKILLDGLVKCEVIKNDNLNCITEIKILPEFSKEKEGIEVIIESN